MGASLTTIDRHYGHLTRDHAIKLLDSVTASDAAGVDAVDAARTLQPRTVAREENGSTT